MINFTFFGAESVVSVSVILGWVGFLVEVAFQFRVGTFK
jgi:hypothetical protein